jgi:HSP20 family protein
MARQTNRKQSKPTSSARTPEPLESPIETGSQLAAAPLTVMKRFGEEMERLFSDFGLGKGLSKSIGHELGLDVWTPQVEMFERAGELVVRADLPGLTKDDINVQLGDGGITIEGERRGQKEEKREGFYHSERHYGKFYRRLPLPEGINAEEANATFRDGVLEITMEAPKSKDTKPRRLTIQDENPPQAKRKAA